MQITDLASLATAIQALHTRHGVPHVVITSVTLAHPGHTSSTQSSALVRSVVGSTMTS